MIIVHELISLYVWVLIIAALMSWFPHSATGAVSSVRRVLAAVTEPLLRPLRQILPHAQVGGVGIDFSVLVAVILLLFINRVI